MRVSVVIDNYNYARYVGAAIDSALAQDHPDVEVVVVDDGSTDHSWQVIRSYGDRVVAVGQDNGGQASALNAGFAASTGDLVLFLDADDLLYPDAATALVRRVGDVAAGAVTYHVDVVDGDLRPLGSRFPGPDLVEGDLAATVLAGGPVAYPRVAMCAAYRRAFLQQVLPIPAEQFRQNADTYLNTLSPLAGPFLPVRRSLGMYRQHGGNHSRQPLDCRLRTALDRYAACCAALSRACDVGVEVTRGWQEAAYPGWVRAVLAVLEDVTRLTDPADRLLVVENGEWLEPPYLGDRVLLPFPHRDGRWWGQPGSDVEAAEHLRDEVAAGATALVVPDATAWWVDQLPALRAELDRLAAGTARGTASTVHRLSPR